MLNKVRLPLPLACRTEGLSRTQKTAKKTVEGMDAQLRERKASGAREGGSVGGVA